MYGVASGEVTRSAVRLWTHWTGAGPLRLTVRVGDRVVSETEVTEEPGQAHVFRAVVDGLAPDARHDYAFKAASAPSAALNA